MQKAQTKHGGGLPDSISGSWRGLIAEGTPTFNPDRHIGAREAGRRATGENFKRREWNL